LRRLKSECALEIPNKIETLQVFNLTIKQAALYQKCLDSELDSVKKDKQLRFKLVNNLKMICNHPSSFSEEVDCNQDDLSNKWEFVKDLIEKNEKIVIFTQFIRMGNILQNLITKQGRKSLFLHGADTSANRQKKIDDFQNKTDPQIIIVSIRAGGSGITLTRAKYVVMFDLWWNPAVIDQAIDRTHRIGQKNIVHVYTLVTKGTIEEKIYNLLLRKKELSKEFAAQNEKWITSMNSDEITELFKLSN